MSEWHSIHQQHTAGRTATIQDRGLFSDVEVQVEGHVFHCHRYVLAQSSDFFFSQFTSVSNNARSSPAANTDFITQPLKDIEPSGRSKGPFSIVSRQSSQKDNETDAFSSYSLQQDALLESLGKPAETGIGKDRRPATGLPQIIDSVDKVFLKSDDKPSSVGFSSTTPPELTAGNQEQTTLKSFSEASELSERKVIVKLNFVSVEVFRAVLDAIYLGKDPVTSSNVVRLYKVSLRLQITSLLQHCERSIALYLQQYKIAASKILQDPQMMESSIIAQAALDVLLTDFGPESSKTDWFLRLSPENLISVLGDQRLNVRHEDEVYRALLDWYEHDNLLRQRYLSEALLQIRLANLSRQTLVEKAFISPYYSGRGNQRGDDHDVKVLNVLQCALAYHVLPDRRHDEALPCAQFRPSQDFERVLLVLGDQSDKLYSYSFARKVWFRLASPPQALGLGVAACTHGDDMYVSGGDKAMTRFWRYRALTNSWKKLKDLKAGRRSHCCVALDDCIYVLGGKDDKQPMKTDTLDSVEMFHLQSKSQGWRLLKSACLPVPVRSMTSAVSGSKIYLLGGRTNGFQETVDFIQCFDSSTQQSSIVGQLPFPTCLGRPFVINKFTFILENNGDILRFQPQNLLCEEVNKPASSKPDPSGHLNSRVYYQSCDAASSVVMHLVDPDEKEKDRQVVRKVGCVQSLNWKWYGAALNHEKTLYVVAGELPQKASIPGKLTVAIDDDDAADTITDVQFICPEGLSMCYVNIHMCIHKSFLIERLT